MVQEHKGQAASLAAADACWPKGSGATALPGWRAVQKVGPSGQDKQTTDFTQGVAFFIKKNTTWVSQLLCHWDAFPDSRFLFAHVALPHLHYTAKNIL